VTERAPATRPVLVTVDDDASVSRAVARDLRRRYGENNRIVRADSGEQALEAIREIKLRGEQVAVILADYRMPGMNGIEFLERAMDLFPAARRILLTAYADTDAAITAINVVDLDYYLLKPWDPPEEKLYPVVDDLLAAWLASDHNPVPGIKVIGHRWSARSYEVRDFLARNQVPYRWFLADEPEGDRLLTAAGASADELPVVITADATALAAPSDTELAACAGLTTAARSTSTTWWSSAAARPGSGPPCTPRPRGCGPCWSSGRRPAGRPGRALGSRTTSVSRTVSPGPS
jgi:thioredoxin reductase (NADPH)